MGEEGRNRRKRKGIIKKKGEEIFFLFYCFVTFVFFVV